MLRFARKQKGMCHLIGRRKVIVKYKAAEIDYQPLAQALINSFEGVNGNKQETQCNSIASGVIAFHDNRSVCNNMETG